jgi:hypothetical protein
MNIDLLPGVPMDNALKGLREAHSRLGSIRSGGASERYDSYIQWANQTANLLRYAVKPNSLSDLARTFHDAACCVEVARSAGVPSGVR